MTTHEYRHVVEGAYWDITNILEPLARIDLKLSKLLRIENERAGINQ